MALTCSSKRIGVCSPVSMSAKTMILATAISSPLADPRKAGHPGAALEVANTDVCRLPCDGGSLRSRYPYTSPHRHTETECSDDDRGKLLATGMGARPTGTAERRHHRHHGTARRNASRDRVDGQGIR